MLSGTHRLRRNPMNHHHQFLVLLKIHVTSLIIFFTSKNNKGKRAMEALKESLEERLVEHDNSRVEIQKKIRKRGAKALGDVDSLEGRGK